MTKEDSPCWGTFDYRQVPGGEDNGILSDYGRHLGLEAVITRDCFQKMVAIVAIIICGFFFMHIVQDGGRGELEMVSIFILSILIQMSTSIHLHYCLRKLR